MRVLELDHEAGRIAFALIPHDAATSDAMELTKAARQIAELYSYSHLFVVNKDRIRAWRTGEAVPFLELDSRAVLQPYGTYPDTLAKAGESVLAGLVEHWLADLRDHWRYPAGRVPGEEKLRSANVLARLVEVQPSEL